MSCRTTPEAASDVGAVGTVAGIRAGGFLRDFDAALGDRAGQRGRGGGRRRRGGRAAGAAAEPRSPTPAGVEVAAAVPVVRRCRPGVQAARAAAVPAPRNMPSERRLRSVERSNSRPRSWLGCGSCGGWWRWSCLHGTPAALCRWLGPSCEEAVPRTLEHAPVAGSRHGRAVAAHAHPRARDWTCPPARPGHALPSGRGMDIVALCPALGAGGLGMSGGRRGTGGPVRWPRRRARALGVSGAGSGAYEAGRLRGWRPRPEPVPLRRTAALAPFLR